MSLRLSNSVVNTQPEHEEDTEEGDGEAAVDNTDQGRVHQEDKRKERVVVEKNCGQQHHYPLLFYAPFL